MKAKILFYALSALILASIHLAEAQQPKEIPRIGFLASASPSVVSDRIEAFRQGLRELGYVEGKNICGGKTGSWLRSLSRVVRYQPAPPRKQLLRFPL